MDTDFEFWLTLAVLVTGALTLLDRVWLQKSRGNKTRPTLIEYARSFFPVLLAVLVLRSFLFEPFRIPSSSMRPTLVVGDFILVNKFTWGLRLPVTHHKILPLGLPERGDVMVFRFPQDPGVDFIKRVVGLPGDEIEYRNRVLYVNGKEMAQAPLGEHLWRNAECETIRSDRLREDLGDGRSHEILVIPQRESLEGRTVVPAGQYFVLGDNRDNSRDSRYWGFVPEQNIVGKAVAVWMSAEFKCGGGIDFGRIGGI